MKALNHRIKEARTHPTMVEEPPEYEPQASGAEGCVQTSTGLVRTARSALQGRISARVPDDNPILTWMVRHAPFLHTRYHIGPDGRRQREKVDGRRSGAAAADFGERVMHDPGTES